MAEAECDRVKEQLHTSLALLQSIPIPPSFPSPPNVNVQQEFAQSAFFVQV